MIVSGYALQITNFNGSRMVVLHVIARENGNSRVDI